MRPVLLLLLAIAAATAQDNVARSLFSAAESALSTDPQAAFWRAAPVIVAERGPRGEAVAGHRTEIRSRWTATHLYLLFVCPFEQLHVSAEPSTTRETNKLWERDVAEVFIGGDFEKIWQYREYQVSPLGEWVDLDIDRKEPKPEGGWLWNSGFEAKAALDREAKVWVGAMKIPFRSIDSRAPRAGLEYRANFYRIQGAPPNRRFLSWRPTNAATYHVPEAFGLLRLVE
jgi:hypothetical protein